MSIAWRRICGCALECATAVGLVVFASHAGTAQAQSASDKLHAIVYAPFPIGATAAYDYTADPLLRSRDFPELAKFGPSLILRVLGAISNTAFLDDAQAAGLRIIAGYHIDHTLDLRDPVARAAVRADYSAYLRTIGGHSAVFAFEIGNEVAFQIDIDPTGLIPSGEKEARKRAWFTLLSELAAMVRGLGAAARRPVTSAFADLFELGVPRMSDDAALANLDFISCNVYRGTSIREFMRELRSDRGDRTASNLPVFISEIGVDAFDSWLDREDEQTQADYVATLTHDVMSHPDVLGGAIIDWHDVWWKHGHPEVLDATAIRTGASPDGWRSDEYLGLHRLRAEREAPDSLEPRPVAAAVASILSVAAVWPARARSLQAIRPTHGTLVEHVEYVTVAFEGLQAQDTVFAVVRPAGGAYYPQSSPVTLAVAAGPQRLMLSGVFFGDGDRSQGQQFELSFLVTRDASQVDALTAAGRAGGIAAGQWPPAGVWTSDSITVVRR